MLKRRGEEARGRAKERGKESEFAGIQREYWNIAVEDKKKKLPVKQREPSVHVKVFLSAHLLRLADSQMGKICECCIWYPAAGS